MTPSIRQPNLRGPKNEKTEKDIIKMNSDANLSNLDLWGIGVIARNDAGLVMASGTWLRPGIPCATTAEQKLGVFTKP